MIKLYLSVLVALVLASSVEARSYADLSEVDSLRCVSDSGRTVVTVNQHRGFYEVTTLQDGYRYLNFRTRTRMRTQESFPATYKYVGRTTGNLYLSLGQTTQDLEDFSAIGGYVVYVKDGYRYETGVTCHELD